MGLFHSSIIFYPTDNIKSDQSTIYTPKSSPYPIPRMKVIPALFAVLSTTSTLAVAYSAESQDLRSNLEAPRLARRTPNCPNPDTVNEMLSQISPQEQTIVRMRFGIGQSQSTTEEVSKSFHVSKERIRQIEARAIEKLKAGMCTYNLLD